MYGSCQDSSGIGDRLVGYTLLDRKTSGTGRQNMAVYLCAGGPTGGIDVGGWYEGLVELTQYLDFPGSFKGNIRNVKLDGEGYFAVTKNVEQPFIVETNKCNVKVLGTELNVMAYAADSVWETSLLEGAVEILVPGSNNSGMRLEPNMMASLKGNRLVKGRIKEVDYFLWREGLLCFNDISVRDMIEKLKLYYGVDIVVNNTRILKNRYTGKFRTKDGVEHVLKVLKLNNKFTYTKDDETNVITIN